MILNPGKARIERPRIVPRAGDLTAAAAPAVFRNDLNGKCIGHIHSPLLRCTTKNPQTDCYQLGDLPSLQVTARASAGLLTCGSSYVPRLPMSFRPFWPYDTVALCGISSPYTAAGPCRNHTGFPFRPEAGHRTPIYLAFLVTHP